jgi:hypothetical protein
VRAARRFRGMPVAGLLLATLVTGCGMTHMQDLNFTIDDRLQFVSPADRSLEDQPVTVSWTMRGFTVAARGSAPPTRDAGYFAVFVDQAPIKPGQTMKAIAHGDRYCERSPTCPDKAYLRAHAVYTTTETRITLPQIPSFTGVKQKVQMHSITIVLMDTAGRRIGESAWELDVRLPKVGV